MAFRHPKWNSLAFKVFEHLCTSLNIILQSKVRKRSGILKSLGNIIISRIAQAVGVLRIIVSLKVPLKISLIGKGIQHICSLQRSICFIAVRTRGHNIIKSV